MEVFIFLSRPDTSNSRVHFSTDGSSRPDRIVTIRRDICSFPGSSTSGSRAYFLFKLHDPTSGESGRQQQLTTRLSSCILDMCGEEGGGLSNTREEEGCPIQGEGGGRERRLRTPLTRSKIKDRVSGTYVLQISRLKCNIGNRR